MKPVIAANLRAAAAVGAILLFTLPAQAVFVPLPPNTPEVPGVFLGPPIIFPPLTGTVVLDTTVNFSIATNSYINNGPGEGPPVQICFRNSDQVVLPYLLPRYLADPGAHVGMCTNPLPFTLNGTLRFLSVDRGNGLRDFYFQVANITALSEGPGHGLFRLTVSGFDFTQSDPIQIAHTNSLAGLSTVGGMPVFGTPGNVAPTYADRDVGVPGDLAFSFASFPLPAFLDDFGNVNPGDRSDFIVIRSLRVAPSPESDDAPEALPEPPPLPNLRVIISGAGTMLVEPLANVPEPAAGLLAAMGLSMLTARRARRAVRSA